MTEAFTPGPWSSDLQVSFTHVECADGEKTGRLAASVYSPLNPRRPLIRVGSLSDDPKEVLANTELVLAARNMLVELEKQSEWLKHIRPQMKEIAPFSIMAGIDQSIKAIDAATAKARGEA